MLSPCATTGAYFYLNNKKTSSVHKITAGIVIMTISNLIVKAAGLMFKIPLTALIGEEGMGYFNSAYNIFTWLYMLSCAGLPTAASVMISQIPEEKRKHGALRIFKISALIFGAVGLLGCVGLIFGAKYISGLMRVEKAYLSIIAVAPTLIFVCQSAAIRGYFQGFGNLLPHSVSQLVEAIGKVGIGVALASYAVSKGLGIATAAAYATLGITVGVAAGTVTLYLAMLFRKREVVSKDITPTAITAKRLIIHALPITLSSSVMSLTNLIDSFIMTSSLNASGMSQAQTAAIWGNYSSLAMPMFNLPPVLTLPIAYALLPTLTEALSEKNIQKARELTENAISATAMLAIPCAVGMSAMAKPILCLLFENDVAERGAPLLTLLAPSSLLLCMLGVVNTVLQASGHEKVPLYAMLAGGAVKLAGTWFLTPHLGKYATPLSTFFCYFTVIIICGVAISALTPLSSCLKFSGTMPYLIFSVIAVVSASMICPLWGIIPAVISAVAVYLGLSAFKIKNQSINLLKGRKKIEGQN